MSMKNNSKRLQIGVIGPAGPEEYLEGKVPSQSVYDQAERVGQLLAEQGIVVVTGGKSGVMEYAARGAQRAGGTTVGVIKGGVRGTSNAYTDIEVLSGMAADGLDELLLVLMCDGLILLGGGAGTLEEIAIAYRNNKPIVALAGTGGWADKLGGKFVDEREKGRIELVQGPEAAVAKMLSLVNG